MCACGDVEVLMCSGRGGEVCFELWVIVREKVKVKKREGGWCNGSKVFLIDFEMRTMEMRKRNE